MAGIRCCTNERGLGVRSWGVGVCLLSPPPKPNPQPPTPNPQEKEMARTPDDILAAVKDQQVEFISLQFTDIIGMVKNVTIPVAQLSDCLDHGVWFDGSAIEGFARIAESDMFLVPDLETFAIVPWDQGAGFTTARMICDVFTPDGKPFAGDPRYVLKTALEDCAKLGLIYNVGPELEFFLFKTDAAGQPAPDPNDAAGYFDVST